VGHKRAEKGTNKKKIKRAREKGNNKKRLGRDQKRREAD